MQIKAKAIVYGDDINTDLIIAGKYTKTLDVQDLVRHAMEDLDPEFAEKCRTGAVIAAGENFGCGSSREQAPVALKGSGVQCVFAKSFSRIFYRSAINIGLPIVVCDTSGIHEKDMISYEVGSPSARNETTGESFCTESLPDLMVKILRNGGMVESMKKYGGFRELAERG